MHFFTRSERLSMVATTVANLYLEKYSKMFVPNLTKFGKEKLRTVNLINDWYMKIVME